ncbi:MAG: hypothetical protein RI894_748 [Bacteroidota bacterium]|jgi:hypothetical protein
MPRSPKKVNYSEGELVDMLQLKPITIMETTEMKRWLKVEIPTLNVAEQYIFDRILPLAIRDINSWNEEDLKMNFISQILPLGHVFSNGRYRNFYEKTIAAVVDGIPLTTKTDFMVATGVLDFPKKPYFHFQEYKPSKKPTGDSMAQLLEAMLIAQEKNKNGKPIYGAEIVGKQWSFVTLLDKTYCISKTFISTDKDDLLAIIAILRHFIHILETELLDA